MIRPPLRALPILAALAAAAAPRAQAPTPAEAWAAFQKLPAARQQDLAGRLLAALPAHGIATGLRTLAPAAEAPQHERTKARHGQRANRVVEFPHEPEALPRRVDYLFGLGTVAPRNDKTTAPAKPTGKPQPPAAQPTHDPVLVHQALLGCVPDADKALAVLLQRLDSDARGDVFAAFLHSWRNGSESFYEALDRTAGTKDSVFFFDAMLDDFRGQFGGKGDQALAGGLQQAHDALHDAFLAYRQYRGFREAVAWALVLPPDAPLPSRLRRYEQRVEGGYSLRQQVVMVAAILGHDPERIVASVVTPAPPLPQPLWRGAYDPYPAWTTGFLALQAQMIEQAGSTDAFLARAEAERRELATSLTGLATTLVRQGIDAAKGH